MSVPPTHLGFPTPTTPQFGQAGAGAGGEWAQAAQYVQMTGQLPPGMTPEDIQQALTSAQQGLKDAQNGQQQMAMQGIHQQAMQKMSLANKMESSVEGATSSLQNMASSIGDLASTGKKDSPKTSTQSSTPSVDTGNLAEKTNPMNFSQNMQQHLTHMDTPLQNSNNFSQLLNSSPQMQTQTGFGQIPTGAMQMPTASASGQLPTMNPINMAQGTPMAVQSISPHLQGIPVGG